MDASSPYKLKPPTLVWTPLEDDSGNILYDSNNNELGSWELPTA